MLLKASKIKIDSNNSEKLQDIFKDEFKKFEMIPENQKIFQDTNMKNFVGDMKKIINTAFSKVS